MDSLQDEKQAELLFQASGSMKLLRVSMVRVSKQTVHTWNDNLQEELDSLKEVVMATIQSMQKIMVFSTPTASMASFMAKMLELADKIDTKEMRVIQIICATIQNQLDYIVNDLDKKRKLFYEGMHS